MNISPFRASTQTPSVDGPDKSVKADAYRFKGSPSSIGAMVINVWFNCVLALDFILFCFNKDKVKTLYKRMAFCFNRV